MPNNNMLRNQEREVLHKVLLKDDGQEYAQVLRMLGNGLCETMCIDGTKRLCNIQGNIIAAGDIVLVGLENYDREANAEFILKYMLDDVELLKAFGELPEDTMLGLKFKF